MLYNAYWKCFFKYLPQEWPWSIDHLAWTVNYNNAWLQPAVKYDGWSNMICGAFMLIVLRSQKFIPWMLINRTVSSYCIHSGDFTDVSVIKANDFNINDFCMNTLHENNGLKFINPNQAGLFQLFYGRGGGVESTPPWDLGRWSRERRETLHNCSVRCNLQVCIVNFTK